MLKAMQIQVSFDTDKEDLADLKKLCAVLQTVIFRREGKVPLKPEDLNQAVYNPTQFAPVQEQQPITPTSYQQFQAVSAPTMEAIQAKKEAPKEEKTAGGGRVIPFEDITNMMSKIYSGKKFK